METNLLIQRSKHHDTIATTNTFSTAIYDSYKPRRDRKAAAKRGLRSLSLVVIVPLLLTAATTTGYSSRLGGTGPSFLRPPTWAFHMVSLSTAAIAGLAAWLTWAEGGFRSEPSALPLYLGQLLLGIVWGLIALGGSTVGVKVGFVACSARLLALSACSQVFRKVNPVAADLVKPNVAWVAFLTAFNYMLV